MPSVNNNDSKYSLQALTLIGSSPKVGIESWCLARRRACRLPLSHVPHRSQAPKRRLTQPSGNG